MPGPILAATLRGSRARQHGRGTSAPHVYRPGETNPGRRTPRISPAESARQDTERRKRQRRTRERKEEERRRRLSAHERARARARWWRKVKQGVIAWATGDDARRRVAVVDDDADAAARAVSQFSGSPAHRALRSSRENHAPCARAEARYVDGALPPIAVVVSVGAVLSDDASLGAHAAAASVLPACAPADLATWREVRPEILPVAAVAADARALPPDIAAQPRDAHAAFVCEHPGVAVALAGHVPRERGR